MAWLTTAALIGLSAASVARAVPSFSLLTGNRCHACHFSPGGGGLRSELGWYSMHDVGLLQWRHLGLGSIERWWQQQENTLWNGLLVVGTDLRVQGFQSHNPAYNPHWRLFPMQAALHIGLQPLKALSAALTFNPGRILFPGQQRWSAWLDFHPAKALPSIQIGFLQPAVGMRYDDHTMLVRRMPGARFDSPQETYLLAPDFAQWGTLLYWGSVSWLSLCAGAFRAGELSEVRLSTETGEFRPITASSRPVWNGHLWLFPGTRYWKLSIGASQFGNSDFALWNFFGGFGWIDHLSVWAEYSTLHTDFLHRWTITTEVCLWLRNAVMPYVRIEHGVVTKPSFHPVPYTTQLVVGAQLFVLPFVELRPEYRWADTESYRSGRFAIQLHMFY